MKLALILSLILAMGLAPRQKQDSLNLESEPLKLPSPARVAKAALAEVGVVEATGQNDGPRIEFYQAKAGIPKGSAWCAAFVYTVSWLALGDATPFPRTGWSPTLLAGGKPATAQAPLPVASCAGFYFPQLGRIGHVELVVADTGGKYVTTVGGNTSNGTGISRNGGGVYKRMRLRSSISKWKAWLP